MKLSLRKLVSAGVLTLAPLLSSAPAQAAVACDSQPSIHCGATPSAILAEGRLWTAFVQDQYVYVSSSDDLGKQFSNPVRVNAEPEDAEHNGENRPKIIVNGDDIYVSWTLKTSPRFTGEIRFSRSSDGGQTFSEPRTINDDGLFTGHRFESLFLTESGHLYLTWIDKRDLEAALEAERPYSGAAVYYAVSSDGGRSFSENYRVANHSCECCRIAIAPSGEENIAILWRQIFGVSTRDHAIAVITPEGDMQQMHRASYDNWQIDACPHHGPSITRSQSSGDYHMSWFSNGDSHQGVYYGRFDMQAGEPVHIRQIDGQPGAGHPFLAAYQGVVYLVWKGFDGQQSQIQLITSTDDGESWSQPRILATTSEGSDYPLLVSDDSGVYLSWKSDELGYLFEPVSAMEVSASD
jgi:hypothetical protein